VTLVPAETGAEEPATLFGAARDVTESRKNWATVHESAALQQRVVERLPDAIIIIDAEEQILFVNPAALDTLGASDEEDLLGTSIREFMHPSGPSHPQEHGVHRDQPSDTVQQQLTRLDAHTLPIETATVPIIYQGQQATLVAARDLTGRKSMARALSRTLDLFDKAFHLGPSALIIARLSDGVILEVSDQMAELTGYRADELLGHDLRTLDVWVDDRTRDRLAARLIQEKSLWESEFQIRRKDGEKRTVLGSAHRIEIRGKICLLASVIDITERRQAASAAQESQALLYKIFHASPTAIGILCMDDNTFFDVNASLCSLVGYKADALVNHSPQELSLWSDPAQYAAIQEALEAGDAVYDEEIVLQTATGESVITLSSFQPIRVKGRDCVLAVMTDITARKQAEDALVQAKERAEEIAQFRSTLLSNMTHEIRTPLTVILGFTSMLHQGIRDEYRRFVHLIERSGRRLLLTLDSLLDLAQLEAGTLTVEEEVYNVFDVVHGTAESLASLAEQKGLSFSVDLPKTPAYVRFDYDLFSHALTHLIDNAVKFTEEGSVSITGSIEADVVRIHVKDTGVGIGEQFRERLFEAFSQESEGIDRTHQGSGLGLTVAQRLIERIGGTIRHASQKGQGSVFTVELPRVS
jgi:PAS domain S-box-containing protein